MRSGELHRINSARVRRMLGVLGLVAVCLGAAGVDATENTTLVVGFEEFGAIKTGMTAKEAIRAYGAGLGVRPINREIESEECYVLHDPRRLPNTEIWVWKDRVAGFLVGDRTVKTFSGISPGDGIAKVQSVYGNRVKIEPSHYDGMEAPDLWLRSNDGRHALRFQTTNGKVSGILAGTADVVRKVEGACM